MFSLLEKERLHRRSRIEEGMQLSSWKKCLEEKLSQAFSGIRDDNDTFYSISFWEEFHSKIYSTDPVVRQGEMVIRKFFDKLEGDSVRFICGLFSKRFLKSAAHRLTQCMNEWECLVKTVIAYVVDAANGAGSRMTTCRDVTSTLSGAPFSWKGVATCLRENGETKSRLRFFFAKLQWKLMNRLMLTCPDLPQVVAMIDCNNPSGPYMDIRLDWGEILASVACITEAQSQMQKLDRDVMQFLGACAGEKCTPPPGSRITKTGQTFLVMVEHTSSFAQFSVPSMLAHHHVDVVSKSMKGAFSEACSWYVAAISRSLAKWSLKAVVTLSVQDVPTVLGGLSTPQARTGPSGFGQVVDLKQRLLSLQAQSVSLCHCRLASKCSSVLEDTFPTAKQWKSMKNVKKMETSAYVEAVLEKVFLPLFDVIDEVDEEMQIALLHWHVSLLCTAYAQRITGNIKCYGQPACRQLLHDFYKLKTWIADAMDSMVESTVKEQVLNSLPLHYVENGLKALSGEDPTIDYSALSGPTPPLSSIHFIQCIYQQPILRDAEREFDVADFMKWKMCRR